MASQQILEGPAHFILNFNNFIRPIRPFLESFDGIWLPNQGRIHLLTIHRKQHVSLFRLASRREEKEEEEEEEEGEERKRKEKTLAGMEEKRSRPTRHTNTHMCEGRNSGRWLAG